MYMSARFRSEVIKLYHSIIDIYILHEALSVLSSSTAPVGGSGIRKTLDTAGSWETKATFSQMSLEPGGIFNMFISILTCPPSK